MYTFCNNKHVKELILRIRSNFVVSEFLIQDRIDYNSFFILLLSHNDDTSQK